MSKKKKFLILVGLTLFTVFIWKSCTVEEKESIDSIAKTIKKVKVPTIRAPKIIKVEKIEEPVQEVKKTAVSIETSTTELDQKIGLLGANLDVCREQVESLVIEYGFKETEEQYWELSDAARRDKVDIREDEVVPLITRMQNLFTQLKGVNFYYEDIGELTSTIMTEEFIGNNSDWIIARSESLLPCGLYQTHRILSLSIEMFPPASELRDSASLINSFASQIILYIKNLLGQKMGGPAVAMHLENLIALASKGYVDGQVSAALLEMDKRFADEMEVIDEEEGEGNRGMALSALKEYKETIKMQDDLLEVIRGARTYSNDN